MNPSQDIFVSHTFRKRNGRSGSISEHNSSPAPVQPCVAPSSSLSSSSTVVAPHSSFTTGRTASALPVKGSVTLPSPSVTTSSSVNTTTAPTASVVSYLVKPLVIRAGILRRPDFFIQNRVGDMDIVEEEDLLYSALSRPSNAARLPSRLSLHHPMTSSSSTTFTPHHLSSISNVDNEAVEWMSEDVGLQPIQCLPIALHDYYKGESFRVLVMMASIASYSVREVQFEMTVLSPSKEQSTLCKQFINILAGQDGFTRVVAAPLREVGKYIVEVKAWCVDPAGHARVVTWSTTVLVQDGVVDEWGTIEETRKQETKEDEDREKKAAQNGSLRFDAMAKRVPVPFFLKERTSEKDKAALWDHRSGEVYQLEVFVKNCTKSFLSLTSCVLELHPRSTFRVLSSSSSSCCVSPMPKTSVKEEVVSGKAAIKAGSFSDGLCSIDAVGGNFSSRVLQGNFFSHDRYNLKGSAFSSTTSTTTFAVDPSALAHPFTLLSSEECGAFLAPKESERFIFMIFIPYSPLRHVLTKHTGSQRYGVVNSSIAELGVLRWSWERHKGDGGANSSGRIWMHGFEAPPALQLHLFSIRPPQNHFANALKTSSASHGSSGSMSTIPIIRVGKWVTLSGVVVVHHTPSTPSRSIPVGEVSGSSAERSAIRARTTFTLHSFNEKKNEGSDALSGEDVLLSSSVVSDTGSLHRSVPFASSSSLPPLSLSSLLIKVRPEKFTPDWMYEGPTLLSLPPENWHKASLDASSSQTQAKNALPSTNAFSDSEEIWVASFSLALLPSRAGELVIPSGALEIVSEISTQKVLWPEAQPQWKQEPGIGALPTIIGDQKCVLVGLQKHYISPTGDATSQEPLALITVV